MPLKNHFFYATTLPAGLVIVPQAARKVEGGAYFKRVALPVTGRHHALYNDTALQLPCKIILRPCYLVILKETAIEVCLQTCAEPNHQNWAAGTC